MAVELLESDVIRELHNAVEERGADFVYDAKTENPNGGYAGSPCVYVVPGTARTSCIVGYVLVKLGVPPTALEGASNTMRIASLWDGLIQSGVIVPPTNRVRYLLEHVQMAQDAKIPWGSAVERGINDLVRLA